MMTNLIKVIDKYKDKYKNKYKYKDILHLILWICLTQEIISSYFGFSQLKYLCDVLLIVLIIIKIASKSLDVMKINRRIECISIFLFLLIVCIGWCLNTVSIPMALWGVRNYGRFFLYYIFCSTMFEASDVEKMENVFVKLFPVHCCLISFQYIVQRLNGDYLSGLFGISQGGMEG